jgi:hypothetical protein
MHVCLHIYIILCIVERECIKLIAFELAAKFSRRGENPVQPRLCNAKNAIFKRLKTGFSLRSRSSPANLKAISCMACAWHTCLRYQVGIKLHACLACLEKTHTYIHTNTKCVCAPIHACICTNMHTYMHTYTGMCMHIVCTPHKMCPCSQAPV